MSLKLGVTGSGSTTGAFSSGQTFVVLGVHGHRQSVSKQKKLPGRINSGQVIISILISISIFNSNTSLIVFHLYIFFSSVYYSSFFNLIFYLENE